MSFMITTSQKELHRLDVIQKIRDQRLSVTQPPSCLGSAEVRCTGCAGL
jgi:hypothetical protein